MDFTLETTLRWTRVSAQHGSKWRSDTICCSCWSCIGFHLLFLLDSCWIVIRNWIKRYIVATITECNGHLLCAHKTSVNPMHWLPKGRTFLWIVWLLWYCSNMDEQCVNAEESAVTKQQLCNDNESERQKRPVKLTAKALVEKLDLLQNWTKQAKWLRLLKGWCKIKRMSLRYEVYLKI